MANGMVMAATAAGTSGVPVVVGLLALSEAAVPIPIPTDLLVLALGERAHAGDVPLVVAIIAVEVAIVAGTAALYLICRRPGRALVTRLARRFGLTEERIGRMTA